MVRTSYICPEMAYLCGVYLSDGWMIRHMRKDGWHYRGMGLRTPELEFINICVKAFEIMTNKQFKGKLCSTPPKRHMFADRIINSSKSYHVYLIDEEFGNYLYKEDFSEMIKIYPKEFLRGLFDGDGGISISNKTERVVIDTYFINKDRDLCIIVQDMLSDLGIESTIRRHNKNYYKVRVGNLYLKLYKQVVGFKLSRKIAKMEQAYIMQKSYRCGRAIGKSNLERRVD